VTGLWDRGHSGEAGTQARRTTNAHAPLMVAMTVFVLVDLALRWFRYPALSGSTPTVLGLSLAAALIGALGATYGGTLVFGCGFNVETAGDHPVWHRSEIKACPERLPIEPRALRRCLERRLPGEPTRGARDDPPPSPKMVNAADDFAGTQWGDPQCAGRSPLGRGLAGAGAAANLVPYTFGDPVRLLGGGVSDSL